MGGAVALASGGEKFEPSHLASPTFVGIFLVPVAIHGLWDAYIPVLSDYGVLGMTLDQWIFAAAIWVVLVLLLHRGVVQMNQLSAAAQKSALAAQNGTPGTDGRGANLE